MAAGLTTWDGAVCPDSETLAAFLDNRLVESEREIMAAHLASCEACYFTFTEVARTQMMTEADDVAPAWWTRRRVMTAATALAAAASVALAIGLGVMPWQRSSVQLDGLVAAVGTNRLVEPRFTAGFAYAPLPGATRSGQAMAFTAPPDVRIAAAQIEKSTASDSSPAALRARGVAAVMTGDIGAGVAALERATAQDDGDAQIASDLAAVYLVRAGRQGDTADLSRALAAANRAIALNPALAEAHFNRALAMQRLGMSADARAAWQQYLAIDSTSGWADEARAHLNGLPER